MKPPWWWCCGWWSPWCVLDTIAHSVFGLTLNNSKRGPFTWICDMHDKAIQKHWLDDDE